MAKDLDFQISENIEAESSILTGEKFEFLEESDNVRKAAKAIVKSNLQPGDSPSFAPEEKVGFAELVEALIQKSMDAHNPISNAAYSSFLIYHAMDDIKIHAGANIDPHHHDHFSSPEHRNCAEKQAHLSAQSAAESGELELDCLDLMLLFRKPQEDREHHPEMLVPCSDCATKQLLDLYDNNGKLVLVLPDDSEREFLVNGNPLNNDHKPSSFEIETDEGEKRKYFYRIITHEEFPYLRIEANLGSKISKQTDIHAPEITTFADLI